MTAINRNLMICIWIGQEGASNAHIKNMWMQWKANSLSVGISNFIEPGNSFYDFIKTHFFYCAKIYHFLLWWVCRARALHGTRIVDCLFDVCVLRTEVVSFKSVTVIWSLMFIFNKIQSCQRSNKTEGKMRRLALIKSVFGTVSYAIDFYQRQWVQWTIHSNCHTENIIFMNNCRPMIDKILVICSDIGAAFSGLLSACRYTLRWYAVWCVIWPKYRRLSLKNVQHSVCNASKFRVHKSRLHARLVINVRCFVCGPPKNFHLKHLYQFIKSDVSACFFCFFVFFFSAPNNVESFDLCNLSYHCMFEIRTNMPKIIINDYFWWAIINPKPKWSNAYSKNDNEHITLGRGKFVIRINRRNLTSCIPNEGVPNVSFRRFLCNLISFRSVLICVPIKSIVQWLCMCEVMRIRWPNGYGLRMLKLKIYVECIRMRKMSANKIV